MGRRCRVGWGGPGGSCGGGRRGLKKLHGVIRFTRRLVKKDVLVERN